MVLMVAAFGAFAWFKGNEHGTQKLIDYQAAQAKEAVRIVTKRGEVTTQVVTKYIKVAGETKVVTQEVEKEVVRYANHTGCLDVVWRRLHDAAALNRIPDTATGTDAAPSASESLTTVTTNYASCNATADRLDGLQNWVREQQKVK